MIPRPQVNINGVGVLPLIDRVVTRLDRWQSETRSILDRVDEESHRRIEIINLKDEDR